MAKARRKTKKTKAPRATGAAKSPEEIRKIRNQIKNVILDGSVEMTKRIVRSVNEEGSANALKFLWETASLFPNEAEEDSAEDESLAGILLKALQTPEEAPDDEEEEKAEGNEEGDVESEEGKEVGCTGKRD